MIDTDDYLKFVEVLASYPSLAVLYLNHNPICRKIPNYRKTLISKLKNLKFLDDKPVFEEERLCAEAFARGGIEAEREERKRIKDEETNEHWKRHEIFREKYMKNGRPDQMSEPESPN